MEILERKIDKLTTVVERGFTSVDKKFEAMADDMHALRDELKGDIARVDHKIDTVEKRLGDQIGRVELKVDSVEKRLDHELDKRGALGVRVTKIEAKLSK